MNPSIQVLFSSHVNHLNESSHKILGSQQYQGVLIASGQPGAMFLDDQYHPFRVNPHFKHWCPITDMPHSYLLIRPTAKPLLILYRPVDFWHQVPQMPDASWLQHFDWVEYQKPEQLRGCLPLDLTAVAYIGENTDLAQRWGINHLNPKMLIDALHFERSIKTDYEIEMITQANQLAVLGHQGAQSAFEQGMSERQIGQAYLAAIGQREVDLPYPSIIALNQHAAILHYTDQSANTPANCHSFLIDAGASVNGYVSDITRSYSCQRDNLFGQLITHLDQIQQSCCQQLKPGVKYTELHLGVHADIAQMMLDFNLAKGSVESLLQQGITRAFFPHGLGHPLGLQVHDVAGFMQDSKGTHLAAPGDHSALRCTRTMEAGMVMTIEPGFYIIDSLLSQLSSSAQAQLNQNLIDGLRPFGGIRIEDNVVVTEGASRNLTREAGLI